jgi:dolichol kinase
LAARAAWAYALLTHSHLGVNGLGVLWCWAYALGVVAFGLLLRRSFGIAPWWTQRLLRLAFAGWVVVAFHWIDLWPASWFAGAFFVYLNHRLRSHPWTAPLRDPDAPHEEALGNAWAALVLLLLFWWPGYQFMVMAGIMAGWVGMPAADIAGRLWGGKRFRFRGADRRTFEAAAGMAAATLVATFITTYVCAEIPGIWFGPWAAIGAIITAAVAVVAWLYTPRPGDQWSVPLLASGTIYFYAKVGFHF